jgi:hypothetical protein
MSDWTICINQEFILEPRHGLPFAKAKRPLMLQGLVWRVRFASTLITQGGAAVAAGNKSGHHLGKIWAKNHSAASIPTFLGRQCLGPP